MGLIKTLISWRNRYQKGGDDIHVGWCKEFQCTIDNCKKYECISYEEELFEIKGY